MVFAVAYHPNGTILATVSGKRLSPSDENKVFRLWDIDTQKPLAEWLASHNQQELAFSPDGNELVVMNRRYGALTARWDVSDSGDVLPLPELPVHELERQWAATDEIALPPIVYAVTYSLDGRYVAYADQAQDIYLVDAATGETLFTLEPDELLGTATLHFLPNSQILISLGYSDWGAGVIEGWNTTNGEKVLYLPTGGVRALTFHPSRSELVFLRRNDMGVRRWRHSAEGLEYILGQHIYWPENRYTQIAFNVDGSILAAIHSGVVEFWDVWRGIKVHDDLYLPFDDTYTTRNIYTQIAYSSDGRYFAAAGMGEIQLYDAETMRELGKASYDRSILDLEFNPDGTLLASYHNDYQGDFPQDRIFLWDVEAIVNGAPSTEIVRMAHFNARAPFASDITFSPDGARLAISGVGAELWDVSALLEAVEIGFEAQIPSDLLDHPALVGIPGTSYSSGPLAFSPNGRHIVTGFSGSSTCYAAVWDVESEELIACLGADLSLSNPVQVYHFLSDTILITGAEMFSLHDEAALSKTLRIWDITTGELLVELEAHFEDYNDIAVSPDGRLIVSAGGGYTCNVCQSYDGSLRMWGVPAGE